MEQDSAAGTTVKATEPTRALTAVRGLAAWWVVAYHYREALPRSTPAPILRLIGDGYLAVDLFFVLSGYVIALNYAPWFADGFRRSVYGRFLALRLSRIYPLHGFMLVLFLANPLAIWLFSRQGKLGNLHAAYYVASALLIQSWGFVGGPKWNVPAWSISTEWLAYLTFPLLVTVAAPSTRSTGRSVAYICGLLAILSLALDLCGSAALNDTDPLPGIIRCLGEFSIGFGVARLRARRQNLNQLWALLGAAVFAGAFVAGAPDYLVMPSAFTLLVYALADETGRLASLLRGSVLQWLGLVSYSTYLSHYFVKIWTKFAFDRPGISHVLLFPAYLLLVGLASTVLYARVERPGQRWCRRRIGQVRLFDDGLVDATPRT